MINYLPLSSRGLTGLELDNIVYIRAKKIDIQRMKSWLAASALCSLEINAIIISTDYDFAANVYDFASIFSRLFFNEIASNFVTNSRLFFQSV